MVTLQVDFRLFDACELKKLQFQTIIEPAYYVPRECNAQSLPFGTERETPFFFHSSLLPRIENLLLEYTGVFFQYFIIIVNALPDIGPFCPVISRKETAFKSIDNAIFE